jgi:outer membrane protein assembly factor BamB
MRILPQGRKLTIALVIIAAGVMLVALWQALFGDDGKPFAGRILLMQDSDRDFKLAPFEDPVIAYGSNGKTTRKVGDLNLCQTVGGSRSLSVAPNGRFFVVTENVGNKITAYETDTGKRLWSLDGGYTAAIVASNGLVYALFSAGLIYGDKLVTIDQGKIVKEAKLGGFDIVLDSEHNALWLTGADIKKCDLELTQLQQLDPIPWCGVSVDVNADGSVWVAEREHRDVKGSRDRLLKISPGGEIIKTVDLKFSPACLRVDRGDGSVWVTGGMWRPPLGARILEKIEKRTGRIRIGKPVRDFLTRGGGSNWTHKYDANGTLLHEIKRGGFTIDIDRTDGSLWIAGPTKVYHYSRHAEKLGQAGGVAADEQKYIAVVPR